MKAKRNRKQTTHAVTMRPCVDKFVLAGEFSLMLGDLDGNPLWSKPVIAANTVVTSGRAWVLKHIMSTQSSAVSSQIITAIGIGTVTTAPATGDTLLGSETVRVAYTTETDNSGAAAPNVVWAASYNSTQGNVTLAEAGMFNTTSANAQTMLAHATFATFAKTTSNTLTVSYTISI